MKNRLEPNLSLKSQLFFKMEKTIRLLSNDGTILPIDLKAILLSQTVKDMLGETRMTETFDETEDDDTVVPLANVSGSALKITVDYLERYQEHPEDALEYDPKAKKDPNVPNSKDYVNPRELPLSEWETAFFQDMPLPLLFEMVMAANYMDIKPMQRAAMRTIALLIKPKSPRGIKEMFGVRRDFTPEEIERTKAAHPWFVPPIQPPTASTSSSSSTSSTSSSAMDE